MNDTLRQHIGEALSGLSRQVLLLNQQGQSLLMDDGLSYYLPEGLEPGETSALNGYLFLRLRLPTPHYLCVREGEGSADLLKVSLVAINALQRLEPPEEDIHSAALRLLQEDLAPEERTALLKDFDIPPSLPRCVMLFQLPAVKGQSSYDQLRELLPLNDQDILCAVDPLRVALIKELDRGLGLDEAEEYALALQDTILEETGLRLLCGIGDSVNSAEDLRQSFEQARTALSLGDQYPQPGGLNVWRRMLLPRFMAEIAPETAQLYHSLLFNRRTASLFSPEMVKTIDMFLEKDLNLSDTARQLYIHRNTLVYRLDKVQRLSGLDLRRFQDAFVYRLFASLRQHTKQQHTADKKPQKGST